jgi:pimeloyl-ACP methyl ester carboxylesterase
MTWRLREGFETGQGRVRWQAFGEGTPVVLLHGTPFSSCVWRDIAAALARRRRVFVWDMLGYGASDQHEDQDVSLRAQARIFTNLLAHWQLDRPAVVAHDFGGAVALRALLLEGATYDRLALLDSVALAPWGTGLYELAREHTSVFTALPAVHHEGLVRAYVRDAAHRPLPDEVTDALAAPWIGERGQAALYRQMAQNDQRYTDEVEPLYGGIDAPLRVIWGENDTWLPTEQGRKLARRTGAELRVIPGAGHLVQEDAPAALTLELAEFLELAH